ncbi:MAG TPA: GtrA family protein [Polyangiaceae bacterium]
MAEGLGSGAASTCVVVPCYNEASRFDSAAFDAYVSTTSEVSFVLVNDGSSDATLTVLQALAQKHPSRVRVLDVQPNQGKAEAVRRGMLLAMENGEFQYAGFWDADLATPLDAITVFIDVFKRLARVDVVFGTRVGLLGRQIDRKPSRHYLGRVFATAASIVLALPVYDTQCGAKLFRVDELNRGLFATRFLSRWIFDIELVARYCRERPGQVGIYELPLDQWRDVGESKVRPIDFVRAAGEMLIIYRTYARAGNRHWALELITAPFVRYAAVGAIGTLFHFATLSVCVEWLRLSPTNGSLVGAVVGALVNYVLNYHLTFASQQSHRVTLPRFLTVAAFGVLLNGGVVKVMTENMQLHYLLAQAVATIIVLGSGFVLNKVWTFAQRA